MSNAGISRPDASSGALTILHRPDGVGLLPTRTVTLVEARRYNTPVHVQVVSSRQDAIIPGPVTAESPEFDTAPTFQVGWARVLVSWASRSVGRKVLVGPSGYVSVAAPWPAVVTVSLVIRDIDVEASQTLPADQAFPDASIARYFGAVLPCNEMRRSVPNVTERIRFGAGGSLDVPITPACKTVQVIGTSVPTSVEFVFNSVTVPFSSSEVALVPSQARAVRVTSPEAAVYAVTFEVET